MKVSIKNKSPNYAHTFRKIVCDVCTLDLDVLHLQKGVGGESAFYQAGSVNCIVTIINDFPFEMGFEKYEFSIKSIL